ncbi:MAG: Crp/Fnr family transcriptional regulator [Bacteroidia bacterium]|nr:Crp/Fnr family transcriptional regulator [Bacteroidia bacterium]
MLDSYHARVRQAISNKAVTEQNILDACLMQISAAMQALPPEAAEALDAIAHTRHVAKGEYLLREGDICTAGYWVESGILRKYSLSPAGKEITSEICLPQDMALSLQSYTLQLPSREYIQAITDSSVSLIQHRDYEPLKQQFPALQALDMMLTEYYALWLEERLWQFHTLDATARYRLLVTRSPQVLREVPLTHIASFLGITLETLSRIRAKYD